VLERPLLSKYSYNTFILLKTKIKINNKKNSFLKNKKYKIIFLKKKNS
jgi:hypothetical protein